MDQRLFWELEEVARKHTLQLTAYIMPEVTRFVVWSDETGYDHEAFAEFAHAHVAVKTYGKLVEQACRAWWRKLDGQTKRAKKGDAHE